MPRYFKEVDVVVHLGFTQRGFDSPLLLHGSLMKRWLERVSSRAASPEYLLCQVPLGPKVVPNWSPDAIYVKRAEELSKKLRVRMDGRLIVFTDAPTLEEIEETIAREGVRVTKNAGLSYWGEVLEECGKTFGNRIAMGFGIPPERIFPVEELSINKREEAVLCDLRAGSFWD